MHSDKFHVDLHCARFKMSTLIWRLICCRKLWVSFVTVLLFGFLSLNRSQFVASLEKIVCVTELSAHIERTILCHKIYTCFYSAFQPGLLWKCLQENLSLLPREMLFLLDMWICACWKSRSVFFLIFFFYKTLSLSIFFSVPCFLLGVLKCVTCVSAVATPSWSAVSDRCASHRLSLVLRPAEWGVHHWHDCTSSSSSSSFLLLLLIIILK